MSTSKAIQNVFMMPLYQKIEKYVELEKDIKDYLENEAFDLSIDIFCIYCKEKSTFHPIFPKSDNPKDLQKVGQISTGYNSYYAYKNDILPFLVFHYRCARDQMHYYCLQLMDINDSFVKIGQFPSKADIESPDLDRFSSILPKERLGDLKRSVGLASHGIGAGSFIYLRRVFEHILNYAFDEAYNEGSINSDEYKKSRVLEKIRILKKFLPDFLVENAEAYSILSKGVHELSEDECLNNFDILKDTIELILNDMLALKEKNEKETQIKKEISKVHSDLKQNHK